MKIIITKRPVLTPHKTKDEHFRLSEPFTVFVDQSVITVPKGFESDGASIPLLYRGELPAWGARYGEAAIVHDYLYREHQPGIDKKRADLIFYEIMKYRRYHWWKARMMYTAVKLFGYLVWKG